MSREIDDRIVQMQFDNRNFERNVDQSIKSLDQLKEALEFEDAESGVDRVEKRMSKFSAEPMLSAVDSVKERFSALEYSVKVVMANMVNDITNQVKKFTYDLTVAPKAAGWNEYELKMGSIQTIMASTGESLEVVNKYLGELNKYSDDTIYSFSDMTNSIGKFTNAGVELKDAVAAIKGVSNVAAVSGANANEASRAMYNFAQALSSGYVKLIDWKSIENANMATVEFKTQLLESAVAAGTLTKTADGMYKTGKHTIDATHEFNDSLSDAWMTTEVLTRTLKEYADTETEIGKKATAAATEVKTFSMMMDSLGEAVQSGWSESFEIIFGDFEEGKALWTELSEIIGGFLDYRTNMRNSFLERAFGKVGTWSGFEQILTDSGKSMKGLEKVVEEFAYGSGKDFTMLMKQYGSLRGVILSGELDQNSLFASIKDYLSLIKDETPVVEKFSTVVNDVIAGKYSNGEERVKLLEEAGYEYEQIQGLVNYIWKREGYTFKNTELTFEEIAQYVNDLTEAEKENLGITEETTDLYDQFLEAIYKDMSGRDLAIESIRNLYQFIKTLSDTINNTLNETFGIVDMDAQANSVYNMIRSIAKFTYSLKENKKLLDFVSNAIKSVYGLYLSFSKLLSEGFATAWSTITSVFESFGTVFEDISNNFFSWIDGFGEWLSTTTIFTDALSVLSNIIKGVATAIADWYQKTKPLEVVFMFLRKVFNDVSTAIQNFIHSFAEGNEITTTFTNVVTYVLNVINRLIASVTKVAYSFWEWLTTSETLQAVFTRISSVVTAVRNAISKWFSSLNSDGKLASAFTTILESLFAVIKNVASIVSNVFIQVWDALSEAFSSLNIDVGELGGQFSGMIVQFAEWLKSSGVIENTFKTVSDFVTNIVTQFITWVKESEDLRTIFSTVSGLFKDAWNGISTWIQGLKEVDDVPKYIVEGLIKGLSSGASKIIPAIIEIGTSLINSFKELFGIHSPSTLFFGFGENIIQGLSNGIAAAAEFLSTIFKPIKDFVVSLFSKIDFSGGIENIKNYFTGFATAISESFANADPSSAVEALKTFFSTIFSSSNIDAILRIVERLSGAKALKGFGDTLSGLGKTFGGFGKLLKSTSGLIANIGKAIKKNAKVIANGVNTFLTSFGSMFSQIGQGVNKAMKGAYLVGLGVAVLLIAKAISDLASIPKEDLIKAGITVAAIVGVFALLMILATVLSKSKDGSDPMKTGAEIAKIGFMIAMIGGAIYILSGAIAILGKINTSELVKGATTVAALMVLITLLTVALGKLVNSEENEKSIKSFSKMLLSLGISLLIMIGVMKVVSTLDAKEWIMGIGFVGLMTIFISAIGKACAQSKDGSSTAATLLSIAASLAIMILVFKLCQKLSVEAIVKGTVAMTMFALFVRMMVRAVSTKDERHVQKIGGVLIAVAAASILLAYAVRILGELEPDEVIKGLAAVGILSLILTMLIKSLSGKEKMASLLPTLAGVVVLFSAMAIVTALLGKLNDEEWAKGLAAVSLLGLIVDLLLESMRKVNPKALGPLIVTTVMLGMLIGAMVYFTTLSIEDLVKGLGSIVTIVATLAMVLFAMGRLTKGNFSSILGSIALIGTTLGGIYLMLIGLQATGMPPNDILALAKSIKMIVKALGAMVIMVSVAGKISKLTPGVGLGIFTTILGLVGGIGVVLAALGALSLIDGFPEIMEKGIDALSIIGMGIGKFIGSIVAGIAIAAAEALPKIIGSLVLAMIQFRMLAIALQDMPDAGPVLAGLALVMGVLAAFAVADYIALIAQLTQEVFTAITDGKQGGLVGVVNSMNEFIDGFILFCDKVKTVDSSALDAVASVASTLTAFAAAELISGITNLLNLGGSDDAFFKSLDTKLQGLAVAVLNFSKTLVDGGGINSDAVTAAANAGSIIADLNSKLPATGGVVQDFFGEKDLGKFSANMLAFGISIVAFSKIVDGNVSEDAVKSAANAGSIMADLNKSLPTSGGWKQKILGEQSLSNFGTNIVAFGNALVEFSAIVDGNISNSAVEAAANAGTLLADLNNKIPATGSTLMNWIKGEQNLETFGDQMLSFGLSMVLFSALVKGRIDQDAVKSASTAGEIMAAFAKSLEEIETNSFVDYFTGETVLTLEDFGNQISAFGEAMEVFTVSIEDVDLNRIGGVIRKANSLFDFMERLAAFGKGEGQFDPDQTFANMSKFNRAIGEIASQFAVGFDSEDANIRGTFETTINKFMTMIGTLIESNQKEVLDVVDAFAVGVRDKLYEVLTSTNTSLVLQNGVKKGVGEKIISGLQDSTYGHGNLKNTFYWIGNQVVLGFSQGIRDYALSAARAAVYVASAAVHAAENRLEVASPSKVFDRIGKFSGEGYVNGLNSYADASEEAGDNIALQSMTGILSILGLINSVMGDDAVFEPVIRPVLDMSNLQNGQGLINGMFGGMPGLSYGGGLRLNTSLANDVANGPIKTSTMTSNASYQNNFYITGDDPHAIAEEVSHILQQQVERSNAVWA